MLVQRIVISIHLAASGEKIRESDSEADFSFVRSTLWSSRLRRLRPIRGSSESNRAFVRPSQTSNSMRKATLRPLLNPRSRVRKVGPRRQLRGSFDVELQLCNPGADVDELVVYRSFLTDDRCKSRSM
jgi:hypothetical protein